MEEAVEFYNEHPDETLILVTGDHETGGLTIGFAGTDYDTFLTNFNNQKISYAKFDSDYVTKYKEDNTDFDTVMNDVTQLFGLMAPAEEGAEDTNVKDNANQHPESEDDGNLYMTQYEYDLLKEAYETTMTRTGEEEEFAQDEYIKYGLPVEVLAMGVGQDMFDGYYDNTDIYKKMADLTQVQ